MFISTSHAVCGSDLLYLMCPNFVHFLKEKGYLPEAVVNFIALLGWSPHGGTQVSAHESSPVPNQFNPQEIFTLSELVERFTLEGLNKRPITVDKKLLWMNKQHFKRKLKNDGELHQLALALQRELRRDHNISSRLVTHTMIPRCPTPTVVYTAIYLTITE